MLNFKLNETQKNKAGHSPEEIRAREVYKLGLDLRLEPMFAENKTIGVILQRLKHRD